MISNGKSPHTVVDRSREEPCFVGRTGLINPARLKRCDMCLMLKRNKRRETTTTTTNRRERGAARRRTGEGKEREERERIEGSKVEPGLPLSPDRKIQSVSSLCSRTPFIHELASCSHYALVSRGAIRGANLLESPPRSPRVRLRAMHPLPSRSDSLLERVSRTSDFRPFVPSSMAVKRGVKAGSTEHDQVTR